jgi:hypothetical protein
MIWIVRMMPVDEREKNEMSSKLQNQNRDSTYTDVNMRSLYIAGGAAPLITIVFYLSELLFISWKNFPASPEDWFLLLQSNKLLGLFYLNALDIFSITLLGVMFLALFMALRRIHAGAMLIAAFFSLLGVAVFVVPRVAMLSLLTLSDRYAIAATEAERVRLLAAGETLGALGTPTPQTIGFFFMAIGVLIISLVMLSSSQFNRVTAWFGILASALTFLDQISLLLLPALATPLMVISGLFWIPWWIMIGLGLFRLANRPSN